jgi:hypothetical protein
MIIELLRAERILLKYLSVFINLLLNVINPLLLLRLLFELKLELEDKLFA